MHSISNLHLTPTTWRALAASLTVVLGSALAQDPPVPPAPFTERASTDQSGNEGDFASQMARVSRNGRYVAFASLASNLTPGGSFDGAWDVYRKDLHTGNVVHVSRRGAIESDGNALEPAISADGSLIVYSSDATNLIAAGTPVGVRQIYLYDAATGTSQLISRDPITNQPRTTDSRAPRVSEANAGGSQYVVFVARDTASGFDVIDEYETNFGGHQRITRTVGGPVNGHSDRPHISSDGRFVLFDSVASNLVPADTNGVRDVFVWDRTTGFSTIVTRRSQTNISLPATAAGISDNGQRVLWLSAATELAGNTNGLIQAQVTDRQLNTTYVASAGPSPADADCQSAAISRDGTRVAYTTRAGNLGVANPTGRQLAWSLTLGRSVPRLVSQTDDQVIADQDVFDVDLSGDGGWTTFASAATTLAPGDSGSAVDVFVGHSGLVNHAPADYGPGIWRGLRPSRLLGQLGLYRPILRDVAVEANPGAGCVGELLVTVVHEVSGSVVVLHGVVDCAGSFTPNNDLANAVFGLDLESASTSDNGLMLLLTTPTQTLISTRSSSGVPFGTPVPLAGQPGLGHARACHEMFAATPTARIYFTQPVTDASCIQSLQVCSNGSTWSCSYCTPSTCPPIRAACTYDLNLAVSSLESPTVSTSDPRGHGDLFVPVRIGGRNGLHHLTTGGMFQGMVARSAAMFLFDDLAFRHGSMAGGRVFQAGNDGRLWEFSCFSHSASRGSAALGGFELLLPNVPPEWTNAGGMLGFALGTNGPPGLNIPVAGTPSAFLPGLWTLTYFAPGSPPAVGLSLPAGFPGITLRTQMFVGTALSPWFWGSNQADFDYR